MAKIFRIHRTAQNRKQSVERSRLTHVSIEKSRREKILETSLCWQYQLETQQRCWPCFCFLFLQRIQNTCPDNMRGGSGSAAVLPAKYKFKNICPTAGSYSWGTVATWAPRKSDDNGSKKGGSIRKEQNEGEGEGEGEGMDMVAFSKPPPQPPFLGSLLAFSLFETWSHRDADDN
ncbi:hypothetical protein V6N13_116618 [Hibiscus sabdariffa]